MSTRYTVTYTQFDVERTAYKPRDYTEAQLLLTSLYSELEAAYGRGTRTARTFGLCVMGPSELTATHPFVTSGILDVELETDDESIAGMAWIEVNDLGHIVFRHSFHAPAAKPDFGWTVPTDFLGTTDLARTVKGWLSLG